MKIKANNLRDQLNQINLQTKSKIIEAQKEVNNQEIEQVQEDTENETKLNSPNKAENEKMVQQAELKIMNRNFIDGLIDRVDHEFTLKDSPEERFLKLEIQWLNERTKSQNNTSDNYSELSEKLQDVTTKLRRLKIKLDKESLKNTGKLIFDEHS